MRTFTSLPRPLLLTLAILFAATTAYSIVWMVHVHDVVGFGTDIRWTATHEAEVREVERGSLAWQAGLRSGEPGELTLRPALVTYDPLSGLRGLAHARHEFLPPVFPDRGTECVGSKA